MEGSESEAIFNSLNLSPQLFINEVLNSVDDLVDQAFDVFRQDSSTMLKIEKTERVNDLTEGVTCIQDMVQSVLNHRLNLWESYCLRHCFSVPEGFSLPKPNESSEDTSMDFDDVGDKELDAQLDLLRSKLILVDKESAELNAELQALERQSVLNNHITASVNEALKIYEQNSMHEMLEELMKMAPELATKVEKLKKKRVEEAEQSRIQMMQQMPNGDLLRLSSGNGLSNATIEELQEFNMMAL